MGKDRDTEKSEVPGSQEMAPDFAEEGGKENTADKPEGTDPKNPAAENETVPDGEIPGQGEGGRDSGQKKADKKDPKDTQIEEMQDRLMRQMAEFDNFRKRTEKEKSAMYEVGARDMIEKILPVLDNFERALAAVPEEEKGGSFAEGVEMIYKQFLKTLEDAGVEVIEAVGQQFNPDVHNAVMHIEDEAYGENEISQELQKGYKYRGTVVRHSMVQVAN